MVFIEPAPYILALIKEIRSLCPYTVEVIFLNKNLSQAWTLESCPNTLFLGKNLLVNLWLLFSILRKKNIALIHVAGWANLVCASLFFLSVFFSIPLTVESDTILNGKTAKWKKAIKYLLYPLLFKIPALFFPGGTRQTRYFTHYRVKAEKLIVAQMTVDINKMQLYSHTFTASHKEIMRFELGFNENAVVFLYVGRLESYKGIVQLLNAFELVNEKNAKLCIVGDGSLRSVVEKAALKNKNIVYAGARYTEDLYNHYLMADALILYSPLDQWGLVINEAMAFAKPVIVSDQVGCIEDLVIPNETGLVIPWGQIELLTQAISMLCENPSLRLSMSNNAKLFISAWTLENEGTIITGGWNACLFARSKL